jgi:NDP-sugar pyrophosphorylase family protein
MKALLIAGGFGTRMRPLTFTRPKHLLPIANRPHIDHVFDKLQRYGIDECVLLTSYLAGSFEATVRTARERGITVEVAHEETPLGTAGALKNAAHLLDGETFLALNGDVLTDADLGGLVQFHRDRGAEATILLTPVEDPTQFGVVPTDRQGRVEAFIEKPPAGEAPTNMINAGVYVLESSVLDRIPEGRECSAERELFPALVEAGVMYAWPTDAYWLDVGTPGKYLQANLDTLKGMFVADEISLHAEGSNVIGDGCDLDASSVVSMACVGPGCSIAAGARVSDSVLLPDVAVGEGAIVTGSILGEGVVVAAGAQVDDATIGDGEKVEVS